MLTTSLIYDFIDFLFRQLVLHSSSASLAVEKWWAFIQCTLHCVRVISVCHHNYCKHMLFFIISFQMIKIGFNIKSIFACMFCLYENYYIFFCIAGICTQRYDKNMLNKIPFEEKKNTFLFASNMCTFSNIFFYVNEKLLKIAQPWCASKNIKKAFYFSKKAIANNNFLIKVRASEIFVRLNGHG